MKSITITLPHPPKELSPNGRSHWAKKAKATKGYRDVACLLALGAMRRDPAFKGPRGNTQAPLWKKAKMHVKAYFRTATFKDPTNLMASLKAAEDGLQDAGIIDNDRGLWPERPEMFKDAKNPRIEITISEDP